MLTTFVEKLRSYLPFIIYLFIAILGIEHWALYLAGALALETHPQIFFTLIILIFFCLGKEVYS
jgi:hypothetical protein